ncbi:alanine racemase, biosynthetic [Variibacter gotjawalensis]|uniref:Alanine racemase n=1 Tax=Variibacter gotjawalensis TaxID=1333996 RepID=A0A0S3PX97_9BRAD|nr:alanine racemase [Variibacter gotjawalensis]NIK46381.1 alanine racemase [Variibacter gotjawalensis]RZS48291.1 alanine racemase [Variibacter gotjawalensis]BAT60551.1 alanine racemase, biosynthetic [Variibacter gotjawalensis]
MAKSFPQIDFTGASLTIDLNALVANWRALSAHAPNSECAAVVKADAYGCGITPVSNALFAAGCRTFFVAHISEAAKIRAEHQDAIIYILNGLLPGTSRVYAAGNFRPVLGSMPELEEWRAFCHADDWTGEAALHVDTGMQRLGLSLAEAASLVQEQGALPASVTLLMSHLASADDPSNGLNAKQIGRFRELRELFPNLRGSLANSSGVFLGPDTHHDVLRPGVALYGVNPTPGHVNPMRPVVRLDATIVQVREVSEGETVGYGGAWGTSRPSRIAIISLGYADGFPRAAGSSRQQTGADAMIHGHRCPLAGRVSMDLIAIDVTDLPDGKVKRGDIASLVNDEIDLDEVASHAKTIGYEVLTRLGQRYRRVYIGG